MPNINFEYLKHHFPLTDRVKSDILERWMACVYVKSTLQKHNITSDFFGQYFGAKVLNYAAGVIEGSNKLGNCPVIGVMLVFFEKKNIPLEDIFTICVNFKNAMIEYAFEQGELNHFLLHEICTLIDFNFQGVIHEYLQLHYEGSAIRQSCTLEPLDNVEENAVACCSAAAVTPAAKVTSAFKYAQEVEIDYEILEELNEIEQDTLASLGLTESISPSVRAEVVNLFTQYAKMIERMMEFQELSYALWVLSDLLEKIDLDTLREDAAYIAIYIKAIIGDFSAWRQSVFIDQNAEDIHYLDKTMLSSIAQLQILLAPGDEAQTDDVEFF